MSIVFTASLVRRNVASLFRPWFVDEGAVFLGAIIGANVGHGYVDVYLSRSGEILRRFGNEESDFGCIGTVAEIEGLGHMAPASYRFGAKLAKEYKTNPKAYRTGAYAIKASDSTDEPPTDGPRCNMCDALGHGYPGGGPCPLEESGAIEY